jgi:hypothetical protein
LPVVLYGCKIWSLTLREEHRLRVFENRVLRGIFGPKSDEVTGYGKKLPNKEFHGWYRSPNIIPEDEIFGACGTIRGRKEMYTEFWWWKRGKRLIGKPRLRREDIKMDHNKIGSLSRRPMPRDIN